MGLSAQPEEVLSDKARHWRVAGVREQATEVGNGVVTQKKSLELLKQDMEGSEVQGNMDDREQGREHH